MSASAAGRVAVVTGATGGIGKEIARGMAGMGMTVVIGARSADRGAAAADEISASAKGASSEVVALQVDVAEQESIRTFAAAVASRFGEVHVLVNNAGAWFTDRRQNSSGIELTLATNVLGPHLLTELLVQQLRASAPARVVNVVSSFSGDYDVSDLQFSRRPWDGFKAYAQSKQALRLLTWGAAARMAGTGVTANAAEPGFVRTGFNRNASGPRAMMINLSARLMADSPAKGADTPLWVATAPGLESVSGECFARRGVKEDKFRDPEAIADLEKACLDLERSGPSAK